MGNDLKPYENITRVFWIRIELKDKRKSRQDFGDIRDVMSGTQCAIEDPIDIIVFIAPYLQQMGIKISSLWRCTLWIKNIMGRSKKVKLKRSK